MEHEAFVYKWTNITNGKIYIGKHKGTPDDGYISSGRRFLDAYWRSPLDFNREIVFFGTDQECLTREGELVKEAIQTLGYENIYNRTHAHLLKEWKRTCLHCGAVVDPRNEEWVKDFSLYHFENCQTIKIKTAPKKKQTLKEWRENRQKYLKEEKLKKTSQMRNKSKKPTLPAPLD